MGGSDISGERAFRNTLGAFATGVTVITARDRDGQDVGITVNSFSSVSLDPPLVLWSLGKNAQCFSGFISAEYFAIHVLAENQEALSNQFASQIDDKFKGVELVRDQRGTPVLKHCAARFDCKTAVRHDGGDHIIIVGEVLGFENFEQLPLLFHGGRYCRICQ